MNQPIASLYGKLLRGPFVILSIIAMISVLAAYEARNFRFDASTDTLVVEGDPQVATYLEMTRLFGGDEFLVLTYAPRDGGNLLSPESLLLLDEIQQDLQAVPDVISTFSILDAPLTQSPPGPLADLADNYKTLRSPDVDMDLALIELTTSPMFRNYLIASNGKASVIRIDLARAAKLDELQNRRDIARLDAQTDSDTMAELESAHSLERQAFVDNRDQLIRNIMAVRDSHKSKANLFVSGVPMIAAEMISYVKADLKNFGVLVLLAIVVSLYFFFRRVRWVFLPLAISMISILWTTGILGWLETPVTVVSSNFISLLAIICISFSIHLIVRYRELLGDDSHSSQRELVLETMQSKFAPCLYTALTTLLAFGSLLGSGIVPVEDFGWMMCLGIVLSFLVTYLVFPAILLVLEKGAPSSTLREKVVVTELLSHFTRTRPGTIILVATVLFGIAAYGLTRVTFDNRFVDYFDKETDIYEGMAYIDKNFGGTLPFDVYLEFEKFEEVEDDFFFGEADDNYPEKYWYTPDKLSRVTRLHDFVDGHVATGKVLSMATLNRVATELNGGVALSGAEMSFVIGSLPQSIRDKIIEPYAKPREGFMRISARIQETKDEASRKRLVDEIKAFATNELDMKPTEVVVTGMMVLFDDMLERLADSQLNTLAYVLLATFIMFSLLLRSILLAMVALIPNILAAASVVSFMGYAGIPMDMMTITIAAICIGIGVDDAIHYLHRFREEFDECGSTEESVKQAHQTIGRAMYFTTLIIMIGFSILAMSNFMPTVYFGVLTALAMLFALLANLTLLPALLMKLYHR